MTEQYLKSTLVKLNKGTLIDQFFLRQLKSNVELGFLWDEKPHPTMEVCFGDGPYNLYVIKNEDGLYVGAVLDMSQDLHWFILPAFRKKGYLTNALKEVILPHLFQNRTEQKITVDTYRLSDKNVEASESVSLAVGFEPIGAMEYLLKAGDYAKTKVIAAKPKGLSDERLMILRKRLNYLSRSLWTIENEVEVSLGKTAYTEDVHKLVESIHKHTWKLEDAVWDFKNGK
jgi:hypothetical protein